MILTCFITPPATNMELAFPFCPPSPAKWRGPVFLAVFLVDSKCLVDLPKSASHIGTSKLGKPELNSVGNRSEFWSTPLPFRGFPNDEFTISIGVLDIYHLILSMFMINPGKPSILFFSSHFSGLLGWTFWSFMVLWHTLSYRCEVSVLCKEVTSCLQWFRFSWHMDVSWNTHPTGLGARETSNQYRWVDWVLKPKNNCILNDQRWNESLLQVLHWYLCKNIQLYLQFAPHLFLLAFNPLMPGCQPPPALTVSCWRLPNAACQTSYHQQDPPLIGVLLLEDLETEPPTLSIPIMRFMRSPEMIIQNDKMVSNKSWYEHILLCICIIS